MLQKFFIKERLEKMKRKQEWMKLVIFAIASVVALGVAFGVLLWYNGHCQEIDKANDQVQVSEAEQSNDQTQVSEAEQSNDQTQVSEEEKRTIQDVAKNQASDNEYDYVGYFYEGLALVSKSWYYGYVDEYDNEVIECKYLRASDFHDGLAAVSEDLEKFGYIDHQGNWVIEPILDSAGDFKDGKAKVRVGTDHYIIDKEGNILEEVSKS